MGEQQKTPTYMTQLLDALGWNQGTRIPLANPDNQAQETLLIDRQNEIQCLKEALALQNQKCNDLNKYKHNVHTEYQENTRLLFAHKQQLEQEVKLRQLAINDADSFERSLVTSQKESNEITTRIDKYQANIARLLKKADTLKTEVCGERGAVQEWRAQLERSATDIEAIEQFTKQDVSIAKALETKRQKLKVEHDHMLDRLNQLVANLSAEERACERISLQVTQGMEQRKHMMVMWTSAVENLRQRDTDIQNIKEDYEVLQSESNKLAEETREQQGFCNQQIANNAEARRFNMGIAQQLSNLRLQHLELAEMNVTLESTMQCSQRELANVRQLLEKSHIENRQIMEDQHRKDLALKAVVEKIEAVKAKLEESLDKTKTSEQRSKELQTILIEEERYASSLTTNQQRAMHCSFVEQQKLLELKNEEKLFHMDLKASKAIMTKLDYKQTQVLKNLQSLKESLYSICYQVETIGAQVAHMEGATSERDFSSELLDRENRLLEVRGRHAARVALLERHSAKLMDDMRRLARDLEAANTSHVSLTSQLKRSMLNVEGGEKELRANRAAWRRMRVEEALTRLRVSHASRALACLDNQAFSYDQQRLQLEAAMNERMVEITVRREMFSVQARGLSEDCGRLRGEIKDRESRIEQLKKRYDIFIASLGKDDSGQQLSVTFFKIKFAAERAELRERGASLDADIGRQERDISALEATLRVVHAAHKHFLHRITPLADDAPEIQELEGLMNKYYQIRAELKELYARTAELEPRVEAAFARASHLADKCRQLAIRRDDCESDLDNSKEKISKHESRLQNAVDVVRHNAKRAKKLFDDIDDWRTFQLALWTRDFSEAAGNALEALAETCGNNEAVFSHFVVLLITADVERLLCKHQRRLQLFVQRLISASSETSGINLQGVVDQESLFSSTTSSGKSNTSIASGFNKRLTAFRRTLASRVHEPALLDTAAEQAHRSSVSLPVVMVGLDPNGAANNHLNPRKPY